jgi:hypothetical protein
MRDVIEVALARTWRRHGTGAYRRGIALEQQRERDERLGGLLRVCRRKPTTSFQCQFPSRICS